MAAGVEPSLLQVLTREGTGATLFSSARYAERARLFIFTNLPARRFSMDHCYGCSTSRSARAWIQTHRSVFA